MVLAAERNGRINIWIEELKNHLFHKLDDVTFTGFTTKQHFTYEEAIKQEFYPMPQGTSWGAKWEYGWFRTEIVLPREAEGKRIFLHPEVGGEMLIWVNGKTAGSKDLKHDGITLTRCGNAGERFFVVVESYAGHGPRLEKGGPCPPWRIAIPEPPPYQVMIGVSDFGIWNEDAFQLLMDVQTLYKLSEGLDPKSLRAMKVNQGLLEFTFLADFELEREARDESFRNARKELAPLLSCVNGSTAPEFTIFGQSHLDLAWLWPWEETKRKCARTLSTQIALSDEYEDYKFLLCEPPIMENVKENYPELYGRLLQKVEDGSFIPEGGMYVESDTNLVSGESLIRQCLYGRKWFLEELGKESVMVWLPDCFGFNGQLPQIMKGCGIRYFTTQKIARALKGCDVFPYNNFWWEGIDGTRILTHFYKENNSRLDPLDLITRWREDRVQQENIDSFLYPFGFGDGGGGATREMVEVAGRVKDLEGAPRTYMESPVKFFQRLEEEGSVTEVYRGELYLPWHRGTYTSQAWIKKENRLTERRLRETELLNSIACFAENGENRRKELESLWKVLLFHQFHDIIPGTSITRVYEEAREALKSIKEKALGFYGEARTKIAGSEDDGVLIFNSLSWEREELAEIPAKDGERLVLSGRFPVTQKIGDRMLIPVKVPSCGYTDLGGQNQTACENYGISEEEVCRIYEKDGSFVLENGLVKAIVDGLGQVRSVLDQETKTDYVDGVANQFFLYQDINVDYDAWEISSFYKDVPVELGNMAELTIVERGPLKVVLLVKRMIHQSSLTQRITLSYNSRRIDFVTVIDWQETHKLLKAAFPVNIRTEEALEEIQFGYVKRPTHQNRRYDADRYEVCNHRYTAMTEPGRTAAVLNDSKYGVSTNGNSIELTLLKSPVWPDMHADKGIQEFTYSFYIENRNFTESGVVREGMQLNCPLAFWGKGTGEKEFFRISAGNVVLETVKMAEDGQNHMVIRCYEAFGKHTSCLVTAGFNVSKAWGTTMEENLEGGKAVPVHLFENSSEMLLHFAPFEIKTLRLIP
ncbi:alpha-mannosidase [Lacrimispora sp.]|uniref:alpha-mannosidase n=1 Tax=Lacrimispora sp. TaxID=2719234 RepID=UPI002858650A|nr:glycoside hydrolase family 38 C-terminal domain-containing protein [Lacrimispora sp.]MDR7811467.1 glycoside hydrolase family 38 C-terminal domain-containing protein [Lacrimispora sp.]